MGNQNVLLDSTGNCAQCYVATWIGADCGGEWIHVSMWLSPFAVHWNYHNIVNQLFSDIKLKIKKNPLCSAYSSLPPPTSGNQCSFPCLYSCTSSKSHIVGIIPYETFAYWLISLSNFLLNVFYVFSRLDSSSLFFIVWMYHSLFIHSPIEGLLDCFPSFGNYTQGCYKYLCVVSLCVYLSFQVIWVNARDYNWWIMW